MEKTLTNKRLEKRFNVWLYIGILYISFFAATFFENEMELYSLINQLNLIFSPLYGYFPYSFEIILRMLLPLINVGLFEIFSRIFFKLSNAFSFGSVTMNGKDFVAALRLFVIFENFALGVLNLCYYLFNFLIPLGMVVISFVITSTAYFLFFMYINKYYLDPKTSHRAFRIMALFYLVFTFANIAGGLLI